MSSKNSTESRKAQLPMLTKAAVFDEYFAVQPGYAVEDALNESSCLMAAGLALLTELSGGEPLGEDVCYGVRFVLVSAKALLDSSMVSIERASAMGGAQ